MSTMPPAPPAPQAPPPMSGHPVQLTVEYQPKYSRGWAVLGLPFLYGRFLVLIPVAIYLFILAIAAMLTAWIMQFAVLFTGRYPQGAHRFVTGLLRLEARVNAFAFGLTDKYPFQTAPSLPQGPQKRVELSIEHQAQYSRGLALLGCLFFFGRAIALLPVLIVLYVLRIAGIVVAWIMQFAVLFTGRYPQGAHDFVLGYLRLEMRASAFLFGLTDKYPGFSLQP
ncbi:MAG: DUF4389 domain-containing protein [Acidimicrobiales bacterium]